MSSITIKNIPESLLDRVRQRAAAERRSVNKEFVRLVEMALLGEHASVVVREQVAEQEAVWSELAGLWVSEVDDEVEQIYAARTAGRAVDL